MEKLLLQPDIKNAYQCLSNTVQEYLSEKSLKKIHHAVLLGAQYHDDQWRKSGEPYITHPISVAQILAELRLDCDTIIAAILHDTIEDTELTKADLESEFGQSVAHLVDGVTKLDKVHFRSRSEATAESFRKMVLAISEDIRVIMIKLADRSHNMQTIDAMSPPSRRRIARETLEIYAPIADKLGMHHFKKHLEELGFTGLYPLRSEVLAKRLRRYRKQHIQLMEEVLDQFKTELSKKLDHQTIWRVKTPYSLFRKMRSRGIRFEDVLDVNGFRIVVQDVEACYQVLGIVHNLYKPVGGQFKDYIAVPKPNGYQSLHTVLHGPNNIPLEVQIRTSDMNTIAEKGIAAHWAYKSGESSNRSQLRASEWVQNLVDIHQSSDDNAEEFLEHVKTQLHPDEVFVFSPKSKIISLPLDASALDFAYAVHTDVGNHAVSAWINGRNQPLSTRLKSGQVVRIVTAKSSNPRPDWLDFITTAKARTAIRLYLKSMQNEDSIRLGHRMLDRALNRLGYSLESLKETGLNEALEELGFRRLEELMTDIAMGNRTPLTVARQLLHMEPDEDHSDIEALTINGREGDIMHFAQCCYPVPGDEIMGHLTTGKGVVIHQVDCENMLSIKGNSDRWIACSWDHDIERSFLTRVSVHVHNKTGVLATVTAVIAEVGCDIEHVDYPEHNSETAVVNFLLTVHDRNHLAKLIKRLRRTQVVVKAVRDARMKDLFK